MGRVMNGTIIKTRLNGLCIKNTNQQITRFEYFVILLFLDVLKFEIIYLNKKYKTPIHLFSTLLIFLC